MMGRIHQLSSTVANQIAAGEVVERPASVVKELVENALDADARFVAVAVDDPGLDIEVRDDGWGMDAEDLPRSVGRHSTSKLSRIEDLEHTATLGFRGEALAAIASVSEVNIHSRPRGAPVGHVLTVRYGRAEPLVPEAMGEGTRVKVINLFSHQPARLKSLRTPAAEFGTIQHVVQQLAIGRPDVQFRLLHNGRPVLETPGRGDLAATLLAIFGREITAELLAVNYASGEELTIRGCIAPAHRHRANRFGQGLFVNGRWVSNWLIRQGIEESFRPQVPDRRFPYFWVFITLPTADVDPNAHPTKAEVRLQREHALRALVHRVVRDTLEHESPAPTISLARETDNVYGGAQDLPLEWTRDPASSDSLPVVMHQQYRSLVPLAQWRAKYIIAQGPDGLCLIDQHAAHERIYFEKFQRLGDAAALMQPLVIPLTETLAAPEWAAFEQHQDHLRAWGFELDRLGGTTIAVRGVPAAFHDVGSHQGLVRHVVELLSGDTSVAVQAHPVRWAETQSYAMAACKAAIKANRPMTMAEMQALLDDMSRADDPRACPHGRPTMLVLTLEEVDRRFGRRG